MPNNIKKMNNFESQAFQWTLLRFGFFLVRFLRSPSLPSAYLAIVFGVHRMVFLFFFLLFPFFFFSPFDPFAYFLIVFGEHEILFLLFRKLFGAFDPFFLPLFDSKTIPPDLSSFWSVVSFSSIAKCIVFRNNFEIIF